METIDFSWKTAKNVPIFARAWKPDLPSKAVVLLVHGLGEHIGRYEHVARMFTDNGYGFVGADLIGHGKSGGQRGHADTFDDFLSDIDTLIKETDVRFPGIPKLLYGHSLGGNLILYYAMKFDPSIAGLIVSSPGLEVTRVPPLKLAVGKLMYALYPKFTMTNSLDVTGLSHDSSIVKAYQKDPLVHSMISARFGLDLLTLGKWLRENSVPVRIPILVVHGTDDRLVNISGTREFVKQYNGDLKYIEFSGGYHELHNDTVKHELFDKMLDWISEKVMQRVKE